MMKILKLKPWLGAFPLGPFFERLNELKSAEGKRRILVLVKFRSSFWTILTTYTWIGFILKRIDNDLYNDLEHQKKLRMVSQGVRVTVHELPPSNISLTNIDIVSFIIFINILMDDVTRFLNYLFIGEAKPKTQNFDKLKKTLKDYEGYKLDELNIIVQDIDWFDELKVLRDKPIIHQGGKESSLGTNGGNIIGIYLRHTQNRKIIEKFMSNLEIDIIGDNVYRFLKDLNGFLCKNFDYLPLEIHRKQSAGARAKR